MKRLFTIGLVGVLIFGSSTFTRANGSVVDGRMWSPSVPMTAETLPSAQSEPSVAVSGNNVIVAWTDSRNTSPDIYASVMLNGAKPADSRVTNIGPHIDTQRASGASVTIEPSGRAFAAYSDGVQIYLARYDVSSGKWLSRTQVTSGLSQWWQSATYPVLASDGVGNIVIAWEDYRNANPDNKGAVSKGSDIYVETCNGNTMVCATSNVKVNDDAARADQRRPRLSRSGASVVIVWEDHRERGAEFPRVYAAFSANGGTSFGGNVRVNKSLSGSADVNSRDAATMPSVAYITDGSVYAVWENHIGSVSAPADIYAAQWNGSAWTTPLRVDYAPDRVRSMNPSIGSSSAGMFVAWQDYRNGSANADVYTARWDGSSWLESAAIVQDGMQTQPALFGQGNTIRLAWQDIRRGNADVYVAIWNGNAWTNVLQINEPAQRASYQMYPELVLAGDAAYAVLLDTRGSYKQLWLQQLGGASGIPAWGTLTPLPTDARDGGDVAPSGLGLSSMNGAVLAVWSEAVYPYGRQIKYSAYANSRWVDPIRLSGSDTDTRERYAPSIAARNNAIAVVWSYRDTNNLANLYASFNTNGTWSAPVAVMQQAIDRWIVPSSIAMDGSGNVFVAYSQPGTNGRSRVFVARRPVNGGAWSYAQVSPDVNSDWCEQQNPQVRVGNDNKVHIVWSGCAVRNPATNWVHDSNIFYAVSSNGGAAFGTPVKVGLTVAQNDTVYDNDTSSRPTLAIGGSGEAMVLYPSRANGGYSFFASLVTNGVPSQPVMVSDSSTNWAGWGEYYGEWYDGDSRGAVVYDPTQLRFVIAYPDRRNGRSPRLYSAAYGDINLRQIFMPLIRR